MYAIHSSHYSFENTFVTFYYFASLINYKKISCKLIEKFVFKVIFVNISRDIWHVNFSC